MNHIYIASQTLGFTAFIISLIAYHKKDKEKIFKTMLIANILDVCHYLLLHAYSGCITKIIALVRNEVIILKEKNQKLNSKLVLFLIFTVYIISGIISYQNIFSILPILAATIYLFFIWNGNELQVKKVAFFCYFLWLIYNICVFSVAGIISNCISIVSTFIAIYNSKKQDQEFLRNKSC